MLSRVQERALFAYRVVNVPLKKSAPSFIITADGEFSGEDALLVATPDWAHAVVSICKSSTLSVLAYIGISIIFDSDEDEMFNLAFDKWRHC